MKIAMNKFFILAYLCVAATVPSLLAAPTLKVSEISKEKLKEIATEKQKNSLDSHEKTVEKAEEQRKKEIQQAKDDTKRNDEGLKRTILKRLLNSMLPPCDREPEEPREPHDYHVRY